MNQGSRYFCPDQHEGKIGLPEEVAVGKIVLIMESMNNNVKAHGVIRKSWSR